MAITWIFEHEGERSYVQRQDELDQIAIRTWSNLDQGTIIVRTDLKAGATRSSPRTGIGVPGMGAHRMLPRTPTGC